MCYLKSHAFSLPIFVVNLRFSVFLILRKLTLIIVLRYRSKVEKKEDGEGKIKMDNVGDNAAPSYDGLILAAVVAFFPTDFVRFNHFVKSRCLHVFVGHHLNRKRVLTIF